MKESTYNYFDTSNNCLWHCRHSKSSNTDLWAARLDI